MSAEPSPRRGGERLIGIVAVVTVVATAIIVLVMLASARTSGIDALEDAKRSQVAATASSFDSRVGSAIASLASLSTGWELTEDSSEDRQRLQDLTLDPDALAGVLVVDEGDTITQGILLQDVEIGDDYTAPWWPGVRAALASGEIPAAISPVGDGVTSDLPTFAFVIALRPEADPTGYAGALVFESAVHADSAFTLEISRLSAGDESGSWFFVDGQGTVVASNRIETLGGPAPVPLERLESGEVHRDQGELVISADVPSVGWKVVFAEDVDAFEAALSDPLQVVGIVLAVALGLVGVVIFFMLLRRLSAAREEERRIRALASSQEEFVSIVSHELRTPVAGVLGFLQTSVDHWDGMSDDERLHAVRRAVSNARRLQALTRDVLDAESVEAGRLSFDLHAVDLVDEARQAVEAAHDIDRERRIELVVPETEVHVEADPDRLQQVLGNLLENARNNSPATTAIDLTVETVDGRAVVSVRDRGAGIAPDVVDRVFEKFVRGRGSSVSGTGLGLYVSKQIVDAHGGDIDVDSGAEGTTFRISLPVTAGDAVGSRSSA